jgi:hypothetical protein
VPCMSVWPVSPVNQSLLQAIQSYRQLLPALSVSLSPSVQCLSASSSCLLVLWSSSQQKGKQINRRIREGSARFLPMQISPVGSSCCCSCSSSSSTEPPLASQILLADKIQIDAIYPASLAPNLRSMIIFENVPLSANAQSLGSYQAHIRVSPYVILSPPTII